MKQSPTTEAQDITDYELGDPIEDAFIDVTSPLWCVATSISLLVFAALSYFFG